jgi:hypothetical protein
MAHLLVRIRQTRSGSKAKEADAQDFTDFTRQFAEIAEKGNDLFDDLPSSTVIYGVVVANQGALLM